MNNLNKKGKIDFIVIGVQKGGTTALDAYLRQHPEVEMADIKETHFFDTSKFFQNEKIDYTIYHDHFNFQKKGKTFGEITPSYIFLEDSIERIKKYNPTIKLIAILRNPIDRAFSNWNMEFNRKNEARPFVQCINEEITQDVKSIKEHNIFRSYVKRGLYKRQIENIKKHFDSDQVLYIKYEEFLLKQFEELQKIYSFLEIDFSNIAFKKEITHKIEYSNTISLEEKKILYAIYKKDIEYVEKEFNWNCEDWKLKEVIC